MLAIHCRRHPATDDGAQPIADLQIGTRVWAYDASTGATGEYPVTAVLKHTDPVIEDLTIDGERIETTPEHPFYTQERGWVAAGQLWPGAHVRKEDGRYGVVDQLTFVESAPKL